MQWVVIAPGKLVHPGAMALSADYGQRLQRLVAFERRSVRAIRRVRQGLDADAKIKESAAMLAELPPAAALVALDVDGKAMDCDQLRDWLSKTSDTGARAIWFAIGGPDGLDDPLRARAQLRLSLSPLTLPHELAEVVLLEQLYRAATRLKGLPYHR